MDSYVYVGGYYFNLFAASLLRKDRNAKDYFYNTDQKHLNLKYRLNEIDNLNSLDELMSISYSKVIITNMNSSNLISASLGMGLFDFSVMNYEAYSASEQRSALEFVMGTPGFYDEKITELYWDLRADNIHESWGEDIFDYSTRNLPNVHLLNCKIEELKYESKHFDLIVSNKVMAAIPDESISSVMDKLCILGKYIYINELLPEEEKNNAEKCSYFIAHDYASLFRKRGYKIDKTGNIDYKTPDGSIVNQKWFLFKDPQHIQ